MLILWSFDPKIKIAIKFDESPTPTAHPPEVVQCGVLLADGLVVLQLLKDHGAAAGRGGRLLGLGGPQGALPGLAPRHEAHQPGPALVPHRHHLRQPVEVPHRQPTGEPAPQERGVVKMWSAPGAILGSDFWGGSTPGSHRGIWSI